MVGVGFGFGIGIRVWRGSRVRIGSMGGPARLRAQVGGGGSSQQRDGSGRNTRGTRMTRRVGGSRQVRRCRPRSLVGVQQPGQVLAEIVAGHEAKSQQSSQTRTAHIRVLELERISRAGGQKVGHKCLDEPACLAAGWGMIHETRARRVWQGTRRQVLWCGVVAASPKAEPTKPRVHTTGGLQPGCRRCKGPTKGEVV